MTPKEALIQAFGPDIVSKVEDWDGLEQACLDPATGDYLRENIVSFRSVLKGTTFTVNDYICATRFCSLVNAGATDTEAFEAVFPDRFKKLTRAGKSAANLASGIRAYKRSRLVQRILEQVKVPLYMLMSDYRVDALNTLHALMSDEDVHSRDRVAAANALATQLAPPKESIHKVEVKDTTSENAIQALMRGLADFSDKQRNAIESGSVSPVEIGRTKIIEHQPNEK